MTTMNDNFIGNMSTLNGLVEAWIESANRNAKDQVWTLYSTEVALAISRAGWKTRYESSDVFATAVEEAHKTVRKVFIERELLNESMR